MAPCWRCTTPIHPVHGNEDRECQACFRDRERRALPVLKKRNLKRMLERKAEDDAAAKRLLDDLDRLRASPPPNPPWLQRLVATVCGVHLSRWLPSVFGDHAAKFDAWANAQRTDSGPEQDDSNVAGRLQVGNSSCALLPPANMHIYLCFSCWALVPWLCPLYLSALLLW
jgi:hypothetical protein